MRAIIEMAHHTVTEKRSLMAGGRDGQGLNRKWGGNGAVIGYVLAVLDSKTLSSNTPSYQ